MDRTLLRRYLPAVLLTVGFLLVFSTRSQREVPLASPLSTVLPEVAGYKVKDQVIGEDEKKIAGMTNYVARLYWHFASATDSTPAFSTYVGYYDRQQQGHTMHSPRNCLPGAGWEILKADTSSLTVTGRNHVVNKYLLKNGITQAVVYYWYQGRGRVVASEYAVKWNLLRDAALEGHTEEALVRIVVFIPKANELDPAALQQAYRQAEKLGTSVGVQLLADVSRVLPKSGDDGSVHAMTSPARESALPLSAR